MSEKNTNKYAIVDLEATSASSTASIIQVGIVIMQNGQVIDEFDKNVHFVEIDIEEDQEIAEAADIMGTPCVQFFKNIELLRLANYSYPWKCFWQL